ncbi:MAG: phosphoribosylglycinamide formyltransferase [Rhizobiaceae bacterium]
MKKLKVAVMISGRGSNMGALARAAIDPDYPAEIVMVLSNRPHVAGLELAKEHGIAIRVVDHKEFENREDHEDAVSEALKESGAELVCLAGYMRILGDGFINQWRGKLINIHPSLLPSFRGIDTHERALERGVRIHGCTVHFVNAELDGGPIIAQTAVPVLPKDTADTLSERVLEAEHTLYANALALIAAKKIRWSGDDVVKDMDIEVGDVAVLDCPTPTNPE